MHGVSDPPSTVNGCESLALTVNGCESLALDSLYLSLHKGVMGVV